MSTATEVDGDSSVLCQQLQKLIVSGELPCSKEEAVTLAGIQLHIQKAWPEEDDDDDDDMQSSRSTTDRLRADDDDNVRDLFGFLIHFILLDYFIYLYIYLSVYLLKYDVVWVK